MNIRTLLYPLALAAAWTAPAFAADCVSVTTVPAVISVPGKYCLAQSLRYEGIRPGTSVIDIAITISSDEVSLDLSGHTLSGGGNASINERSIGILVSGQKNVTVRNGAIRKFGRGLSVMSTAPEVTASGHVVEGLLVDGMLTGCMTVASHQATVRDNRVSNCGGTAIYAQGTAVRVLNNTVSKVSSTTIKVNGIAVAGQGSIVQNNSINNVFSNPLACGILANSGVLVKDNVLYNPLVAGSIAICAPAPAAGVMVDNNAMSGFTTGVDLGAGNTTNRYRNNTVHGALTAAYVGGTNLGGNN